MCKILTYKIYLWAQENKRNHMWFVIEVAGGLFCPTSNKHMASGLLVIKTYWVLSSLLNGHLMKCKKASVFFWKT
jgi:dethiobiotin synthetase